jgi:hypothetical protein
MVPSEKKSSPLPIAVSWIIVLIPLGWGIVQSVVKSLPLFQMPAASVTISSSSEKSDVEFADYLRSGIAADVYRPDEALPKPHARRSSWSGERGQERMARG